MAKRFTDTEKWKKRWFRTLKNDHKVFWMYLLDNCCHAGIWEVDFDLAGYFCQDISEEEIRKVFSKQYAEFHKGKRWFIKDFIEFQYTKLNPNVNAHKSVLQKLEKYNLLDLLDPSSFVKEPLNKGLLTVKDKDKDKVQVKVKRKEGKASQISKIDIDKLQEEFDSVNVGREFKRWQNYMLSKGVVYKNYNAAFRNWLDSDWIQKKRKKPIKGFLKTVKERGSRHAK